jgi:DNA invertase Pin-like site-specific DNA recombinase
MNTTTNTPEKATRYVAYYRVSTEQQGRSGLGLDAQRAAVLSFVKDETSILAHFTEVESGKNNSRTQLQAAIDAAKKENARLVIAKLDRLSRNVGFIFQLRDSKVDFVCCDIPDANTLTVGIFAVLAQHERELISSRTRAALAQSTKKLGTPENLTDAARMKAHEARRADAKNNEANRRASAFASQCRAADMKLQAICDELNSNGFKTRNGCEFQRNTVKRLLDRVAA